MSPLFLRRHWVSMVEAWSQSGGMPPQSKVQKTDAVYHGLFSPCHERCPLLPPMPDHRELGGAASAKPTGGLCPQPSKSRR
jgi:hypothetical protein